MKKRKREEAIGCVYLEPNPQAMRNWLIFDVDDQFAWFLPEERGLPTPNYVAVNKRNGHAHVGYLLEAPVSLTDASRAAPMKFLADIEKGMARRLGADFGYSGHTTRNPFNPQHETDWRSDRPWRLDELNDSLDKKDKVWVRQSTETTGTGRNVTIFDSVRKLAYKNVLKFKKGGKDESEFRQLLMDYCHEVNRYNFKNEGLGFQELWGIARSTAKWVWKEFSLEKFSRIQSIRGKRAWRGHISAESTKPWMEEGISRATYYRRRTIYPDMAQSQSEPKP